MTVETVTLSLDGRPQEMRADAWRVWLRTEPPSSPLFLQIDPNAPIDWAELDRLPALRELTYEGTDAGIEHYLATRPGIETLTLLDHRRSVIDLRASSVSGLSVDHPGGPLAVRLPPSCNGLTLLGPEPIDDVEVHLPDGKAFNLGVHAAVPSPARGLDHLTSISFWRCKAVDLSRFTALTDLTRIGFHEVDTITGLGHLRSFTRLATLRFSRTYDVDMDELPPLADLPALTELDADEIRSADAAVLTERLGALASFDVQHPRSDTWLRENLDNPFRAWPEEHGTATGNAAKAAYKKAAVGLRKAAKQPDAPGAEQVLHSFIDALNKRDAKESFDTTMAEDAAEAFSQLATSAVPPIDEPTATEWFDRWRAF